MAKKHHTKKHHEGSKVDIAEDKRGADKAGMSMKAFEKSPQDMAMDAAGSAKAPPRVQGKMPPASSFGLAQAPGEEEMGGMGGM